MLYDPKNWYWTADDDRIFASARIAIVDADDPDFVAWLAAGHLATPWPRDLDGGQTTAALQDVLTPYGLFADLRAYAAMKRWQAEIGGIVVAGVPIATDDRSKLMITGARIKADADAGFTTPWAVGDEVFPLTSEQIVAISDAVLSHVSEVFAAFAATVSAIADGSITTKAEVDAAFA